MRLKKLQNESQNEDMIKPLKTKSEKNLRKPVYMHLKEKVLVDLKTEAMKRGMSRQDLIEKILETALYHKSLILNLDKK